MEEQIKEDHAQLQRLWKNLGNGHTSKHHEEETVKLITWIRSGVRLFKELRQRGIEGIYWGELKKIERDIQNKERILGLNTDYP